MKYDIDTKPGFGANLLYGLQWWVVTIPAVVTMGVVLGKIHFGADLPAQGFYMQKLFFVLGITLLIQVMTGHRLPLVPGPASVLLIGILASLPATVPAIYTGILCGGVFLTLTAAFGLLKYLRKIFTARVIVVIMLLIPLTLGPTIIKLVFGNENSPLFNLFFTVGISLFLLLLNHLLKGVWKSVTLIAGLIVSTLLYRFFCPATAPLADSLADISGENVFFFIRPEFDAGVVLAFLFCAVALIINEVGSIEAVGQMLSAEKMEKRSRRGVGLTGLANIVAGSLGVIGPIDYSSSPGIIASTRCASRFPFIPTALLLIVCAFVPALVEGLLVIPDAVMGTVLLYVMISQFSAGFQLIVRSGAADSFNGGTAIGFPLMVALLISFMPAGMAEQIPSLWRPVVCNGFVMGVITVFITEHLIYGGRKKVH